MISHARVIYSRVVMVARPAILPGVISLRRSLGEMSEPPIKQDAATLIALIRQLMDQGADVDAFLDPLHHLVGLSPVSIGSVVDPGHALYRVTKHHTAIPRTIDELWFPPAEMTPPGRANRRHQPLFYCTSDPNCAFRETAINVGQTAVFAKWVTTSRMVLHDLGYTAQVLARAGSRRSLPDNHRQFYDDKLTPEGRQIRDFIAMEFTDPNANTYAFTTAVAEFHLRADEFMGTMYPAVAKEANADNLALRPSFVRGGMKLQEAQLQKIDTVEPDGSVEGVILADLVNVSETGELAWKFRESGGPTLPPRSAMAMEFKPGDRRRVQIDNNGEVAELEIDGRAYQVRTGYTIETTTEGDVIVRNLKGEKIDPLLD